MSKNSLGKHIPNKIEVNDRRGTWEAHPECTSFLNNKMDKWIKSILTENSAYTVSHLYAIRKSSPLGWNNKKIDLELKYI